MVAQRFPNDAAIPSVPRTHISRGNPMHSFLLNSWIVSETLQPSDFRFAAKPGQLPFGVVAMGLLGGMDCLLAGELAGQDLNCLFVSQRSQGTGDYPVFLLQELGLLDHSGLEHPACALIDAIVERWAVGIEPDSQNAEAAQGVTALLPEIGHLLPRGEADLDGADQFGNVIGVDLFSGGAIEVAEDTVQMIGAAACGAFAQ